MSFAINLIDVVVAVSKKLYGRNQNVDVLPYTFLV